jgi:ectoine hydroxylase-related dioxygenase (phytanoyl-CoA dioxygenase family)
MGLAGTKICTVWIALDHVTADTGAMFFVRGSHKDQKLYRPILLGTGRERPTGESRDAIPDVWSQTSTGNLVSFDLDPGDCTVHHAWTLHGAKANSSRSERRRGLAIRYVGDDVSELPSRFGVLRGDRA